MAYKIKNWHQFQHFKDRTPPWIKLYRGLLDDVHFHSLDGDAAKTLIMLWLLASETDGYLPDISVISFRLRVPVPSVSKALGSLNHWIIKDDGDAISGRYQDDISMISLTRSRETETETETETDRRVDEKPELPDWLPKDDWQAFKEMRKTIKKPMTGRAEQMIIKKLQAMKSGASQILQQSIINCWQDIYELKGSNETHQRASNAGYQSGGGSYGRKEPYKRNVETIGGKK